MTTLAARPPAARGEGPGGEAPDPVVVSVVARLHDAADQMVAFSQSKGLLREAAALLERLESEVRLSRIGTR
jgi:hypothetical protein